MLKSLRLPRQKNSRMYRQITADELEGKVADLEEQANMWRGKYEALVHAVSTTSIAKKQRRLSRSMSMRQKAWIRGNNADYPYPY